MPAADNFETGGNCPGEWFSSASAAVADMVACDEALQPTQNFTVVAGPTELPNSGEKTEGGYRVRWQACTTRTPTPWPNNNCDIFSGGANKTRRNLWEYICIFQFEWSDSTHSCQVRYDERKAAGAPPCGGGYCNPVNVATGNKYQAETDYAGAGAFPLRLERYYNSSDAITDTFIGSHWRHTYDRAVVEVDVSTVDVYRQDGKVYRFTASGGNWVPDTDVTDRLVALGGGGWQYLVSDNTIEEYDTDGRLIALVNAQGLVQTLDYDVPSGSGGDDDPNTLDEVSDPFGRTLRFTYSSGRIVLIEDPAGNDFEYAYDVVGNLDTVTYPDPNPSDGPDERTYHYEDTNYPHALTGITDENGSRFATYEYDDWGRVTRSEHAGEADSADFTYNSNGTTTVTEASGNVQTLGLELSVGLFRPKDVTGGPCSTCGGQSADTLYDTDGFIIAAQDFNGNITTYERDSGGRGLEVSRTEGQTGTIDDPDPTAVTRTIETEWDTTRRVPVKITESGRETTFTYESGSTRLASRTVKDTVTNETRTTSYTWEDGQLKTVNGPRRCDYWNFQ